MKYVTIILFFLLSVCPVEASLQLNELYPSPDKSSTEWIEIVNRGTQSISTNGYRIRDAANNTLPLTATQLESGGFYIASASSLLNNSGDTVYLVNPSGEVVDTATYSATLTSSQSVARCTDTQWIVTTSISKEQDNLEACIPPSPTPLVSPETTPVPTATSAPPSPTIVSPTPANTPVVSEVMTSPESGEQEWIELYNPYSFALPLDEFQIDDGEGGSRPKFLSGTIPPHSYFVVTLSSGIFNNEGDQVRLLSSQNNVIDAFSYTNGSKNKTWGRLQPLLNTAVCMMAPSPGEKNTLCLVEDPGETAIHAAEYNRSGSETGAGSRSPTGQTTVPATPVHTLRSGGGSDTQAPAVLEEYAASFSTPDLKNSDIPVSVQLRSPVPPDSRSTTVALTVSLASSVFSFLSILFKINRVYLPL